MTGPTLGERVRKQADALARRRETIRGRKSCQDYHTSYCSRACERIRNRTCPVSRPWGMDYEPGRGLA